MLSVLLIAIAAWILFGAIGSPFLIGKPRKPYTAGTVVGLTVISLFMVSVIIIAAVQLWGV